MKKKKKEKKKKKLANINGERKVLTNNKPYPGRGCNGLKKKMIN
jgi:hypothetical protein